MANNLRWLFRRLKAMSLPEVLWRLDQRRLYRQEDRRFRGAGTLVTETIFDPALNGLSMHPERLHLCKGNRHYSCGDSITLLGGFDYNAFRSDWHASFLNGGHWPKDFSYDIDYKQREDIGDVRLNWELNRHAQFLVLAKNYAVTGDLAALTQLEELFQDWGTENPFLCGISWTSTMEIAIRASNWCYTYAFLSMSEDAPPDLMERLRKGIINMTAYVVDHYSRFSSANNHLIVEAYAIGQSGILLDHWPWVRLAIKLLTRELPVQNYSDGVNKELSLHYQAFYMEAMGLMLRLLQKNSIEVPECWYSMLREMCRYFIACVGPRGEVVEFGDSDDGRILCMGQEENYYVRILELYSFLLPERYVTGDTVSESNCWLFTQEERQEMLDKPLRVEHDSRCFSEGGNSILRSKDGRVLIGIDHAALGFGSLAAHGHADALSFQMLVDGVPVLVDPGTYTYHSSKALRDAYRATCNHNTVCFAGRNQSEMLGPFLWGRKAQCKLLTAELGEEQDVIVAEHDGYLPTKVQRGFRFDRYRELIINDRIEGSGRVDITFVLGPEVRVESMAQQQIALIVSGVRLCISTVCSEAQISWSVRKVSISPRYAEDVPTQALTASLECRKRINVETILRIVE